LGGVRWCPDEGGVGRERARRREVESEKKAWWLWFSRGREFETRQWRELGESSILIDLSFRESWGISSGVVSRKCKEVPRSLIM
jgi:hypothetical protein